MASHHFFKVLIEDFTKRLLIPKAFIKQMPEESGTAVIQGFGGNFWPVKLNRTTCGTYLEDGWSSFVKDHSLTLGEILVFSYLGSLHFKITVFDRSTCNRENTFGLKVSHGLTCHEQDQGAFIGDEAFVVESPTELTTSLGEKFKSAQQDEGAAASTPKEKRLGNKAVDVASCFISQFPCFLISMKPYMVRQSPFVTIPKDFACNHLRKTLTKMTLQNLMGKTWKVSLCLGKPNRLSVGWKVFASDNHLKKGDYCVFELVKEDVMQVHIYRC